MAGLVGLFLNGVGLGKGEARASQKSLFLHRSPSFTTVNCVASIENPVNCPILLGLVQLTVPVSCTKCERIGHVPCC